MRLTLGKKLGLGFGVILAFMVSSTTMTYLQSAAIKQGQDITFDVGVPQGEATRELQRDLNQTQSKGRQVILAGAETARRETAKRIFDADWGDLEKDVARMDELTPQWTGQQDRDLIVEVKKQLPNLRRIQEE